MKIIKKYLKRKSDIRMREDKEDLKEECDVKMKSYPIPTHLKNTFEIDENESNNYAISGKIVCNCGCNKFKIYHNMNREYNHSVPYSEQEGLKILIRCIECEKEHLLFDQATQGHDGFVCHDLVSANNDHLELFQCGSCMSEAFIIKVDFEAEDLEQFIEECVTEFPEEFSPEDYVDAFNWIVITLTCNECNEIIELVNLELS